jgi:hypothetical protein
MRRSYFAAKGKNPPIGTIKNFVHLLNDRNFDFEEEIGIFPSTTS